MPITLNGDGTVGGVTDFTDVDGGNFVATTITASGNLTGGQQSATAATLFVDDANNTVGINTLTPAAGVFLQIVDSTDPVVSLNNTAAGEVRLGCGSAEGYIGTESSTPFVLTTGGDTKVHIATNGNVGIGQNNPVHKLHVNGDIAFGNAVVLSRNTSTGLVTFTDPTPEPFTAGIAFRSASTDTSKYQFQNVDGTVNVFTISARGNAAVGRNVPRDIGPDNVNFDVQAVTSTGVANIDLTTGTTRQASIFATSTATQIATAGSTPLIFGTAGVARMTLNTTGNLEFPNGRGIDFSASEGENATSSILDDYEEGTWTPVIADERIGGNTGGYNRSDSWYVKIGRQVTVFINLFIVDTTGMTPANTFWIRNLPYAAQEGSPARFFPGNGGSMKIIDQSSLGVPIMNTSGGATTQCRVSFVDNTGTLRNVLVEDLNSGLPQGLSDMFISITYQVP